VSVSTSDCGSTWRPTSAGHQQLTLHNTDLRSGEILLTDARTGAVFADVDPLASGATAELGVDLGPGRYTLRCVMEDADVITGAPVTLTGSADRVSPSVLPVSQNDLIAPTKQYEAYVLKRLPGLRALTTTLAKDIANGNLEAARADWLPAHVAYESLGAAYGAFGDDDARINGLASGLPHGTADAGFTGFHRLEYGLWHGQSASALKAPAATLLAAVNALTTRFASAQLAPAEVSLRAHEIIENSVQFELTGQTDYGSGTNLATVAANLAGTSTVLTLLRPLLSTRYPALAKLDAAIRQAETDVDVERTTGHWTPLQQLSRTRRERLNSDFSELSEPRRTS
jgi:iron uptake system component EfeO